MHPTKNAQKRVNNSSTIEGVGTFIYSTSTGRYLFLLRDSTKYPGTWGLAGGKVDPGEQILESLYRELTEELGYQFYNNKVIPIEKFTSNNNRFSYHTFLIPVAEEFIPILNYEHRGFCWVALEDHPTPLHPGVWRTISFNAVITKIKTLELLLKISL
jgi:8-oxo-dGTP pyrophosphatase MutT (NUDIX family)